MEAGQPATGRTRVAFRTLTLADFRNYRQLRLALDGRHVVLTGHNGAGKTNLLEAFSLFAPGRGLRRAGYDAMARKDGVGGFALGAGIARDDDIVQVGTGVGAAAGDAGGGQRVVRIDGTPARSAETLNALCRITWLTPAMDGVFTGPAADRRRMLDRMVLALHPDHGRHALDFEKAMRGRNRLFSDDIHDPAWLGALEQEIAFNGAAMTQARLAFVDAMNAIAREHPGEGGFPVAGLAMTGEIEAMAGHDMDAETLAEIYRERLAATRAVDRQAGRTLIGPHRSDLTVTHLAKDMPAALASTGEQKALLTGLILAHADLIGRDAGMRAVLLLDEIGAHFDAGRRAALFDILDRLGGQAIMTGTEPHLFAALGARAQYFTVDDATLAETGDGGE